MPKTENAGIDFCTSAQILLPALPLDGRYGRTLVFLLTFTQRGFDSVDSEWLIACHSVLIISLAI